MSHFSKESKLWPCVLGGVAIGAAAGVALAHLWTPSFCRLSKPTIKTTNLELVYWPGRGLMEVPRMLLAIAGKFPDTDYKNGLYGMSETAPAKYDAIKDKLSANLGRMPALFHGDNSVGQSVAINYYLAQSLGLMGNTVMEAAQIISIQEHLRELREAFYKLMPYGSMPTDKKMDTFFTGGATDSKGPADITNRDRYLPWFVARMETIVGAKGFAVGSKISLADVLIYNAFAETLRDDESSVSAEKKHVKEPFYSKSRVEKALENAPNLRAIIKTVSGNGNIKKWLEVRGKKHKLGF